MSEPILRLLNIVLIALIYLFLWRVTRVVKAEIAPRPEKRKDRPSRQGEPPSKQLLKFIRPQNRAGEELPIAGEMTIGRGGGCNIILAEDSFVSTVHARIYSEGNRAYVEDLGSTNGTFVNGKQVDSPRRLKRGDQITIGGAIFEVVK